MRKSQHPLPNKAYSSNYYPLDLLRHALNLVTLLPQSSCNSHPQFRCGVISFEFDIITSGVNRRWEIDPLSGTYESRIVERKKLIEFIIITSYYNNKL